MTSHAPSNAARKRLIALVVILLAGFTASVLVAWATEVVRAYRASVLVGPVPFPVSAGDFTEDDGAGHTLQFTKLTNPGFTTWLMSRVSPDMTLPEVSIDAVPGWVERAAADGPPCLNTQAYGFPFRCLKYTSAYEMPGSSPSWLGMTHKGRWLWERRSMRMNCQLPLLPILPGLVANTLIFAASFGLLLIPFATFRRRRLRRGHCPFCNYDIRGEFSRACSECGRTANAAAAFHDEPGTK